MHGASLQADSSLGERKNQEKKSSKHSKVLGRIFHVYGEKNPRTDWAQILFGGRCPQRNHVVQIW